MPQQKKWKVLTFISIMEPVHLGLCIAGTFQVYYGTQRDILALRGNQQSHWRSPRGRLFGTLYLEWTRKDQKQPRGKS